MFCLIKKLIAVENKITKWIINKVLNNYYNNDLTANFNSKGKVIIKYC